MKKYWLIKSEAGCYSIDDLKSDGKTGWTGVRNYQARNFMRDQMSIGDEALYYHSGGKPPAVVGSATVISKPHPDNTAFDLQDDHFDPKSTPENPIWVMVDMQFKEKFPNSIGLDAIKTDRNLKGIDVARRGNRLSIQPVSEEHYKYICKIAKG